MRSAAFCALLAVAGAVRLSSVPGSTGAHDTNILGGGAGTGGVVVNHNVGDGDQAQQVHVNEAQPAPEQPPMQPEAEAMQVMDQSQMGNAVGTATPEPVPEGVVGEAKLMAEIKHEEEVVHENESSTDAAAAATGSDKTPIEAAQAHPIGETAAEAAHEKAESLARTAEVDAMAQDEVARAAEAMLNEMCTLEMRHIAQRNLHHPAEALAARSIPRESDVSVSLGTDLSSAKLAVEVHSALVGAGCRIVDRWCAGSRCVFRTCFCRPVRAEAGKAGLVAKEESITKEDAKLEGDLGALEEKEQELEDVGDPGAAKVVAAEAKKVESAVVQNEKTKVAVEKAEVEMDEKAAEEDPRTACEEGFIEVPT
eukprot:CAMPEP_0173293414 /NCGR_PEP_ID=MMETSP1143-20121109/13291_1 /TAXON_ID=483371 /ORGANISM="non described non described, Strain CCMP2298" /LENGTH=366 /DNA_ID=CAMNT_0014232951 /DNA_START=1 /DNA_END=1097 /DNA_ORIENTATION=+